MDPRDEIEALLESERLPEENARRRAAPYDPTTHSTGFPEILVLLPVWGPPPRHLDLPVFDQTPARPFLLLVLHAPQSS